VKPLAELPASKVRAVFFDIDDTLTTDGHLTAEAYGALERLKESGRRLICVTGRPAGWCDHIGRMWPVDAVIGENGAFYFHLGQGRLHKRFRDDAGIRAQKRARLEALAQRILAAVPGTALAADQPYRETDLAIDYCEDVPALPLESAERVASLMKDAGLTARISSIHVNGWFGDYDKLSTARLAYEELFGESLPADARAVYAGDSPNDEPMFGHFQLSVGVANVRRYSALLRSPPKFVTASPCGAGFRELADHLLA